MTPRLPYRYGETGEGWAGPHHCAKCAASVDEVCHEMERLIAVGTYNRRGYTLRQWVKAGHTRETFTTAVGGR